MGVNSLARGMRFGPVRTRAGGTCYGFSAGVNIRPEPLRRSAALADWRSRESMYRPAEGDFVRGNRMDKLGSNTIGSIQIFCRAAELESFTAAANSLGLTPAAVSRSVARIESRLGARLFARSTRKIRLTDEGKLYHQECLNALHHIEQVEKRISGAKNSPAGTLKLSAPSTYAQFRLTPIIEKYRRLYPEVDIELNVSNTNIDFVQEGYDLAIRLGRPADSRLVARSLEVAKLGVYASRQYLERKGRPQTLQDLTEHDCIRFLMPGSGRPLEWRLSMQTEDIPFMPSSKVTVSGDVIGAVALANSGGGLFQIYDFIAQQPQFPELVEVLHNFKGASRTFSLVYQQNRMLSAKTRSFIELLFSEISFSS